METFAASDGTFRSGFNPRRMALGAASAASLGMARAQRPFRRQARALIVPPADEGSLGDAAMLNAARATLKTYGIQEVDLLLKPGWQALKAFDRQIDASHYFYGGWQRKYLPIRASLGRYSHAYFVGADVVDGVYNPESVRRRLGVLGDVATLGGEASILGCSFSETPDPDCVEALRRLPRSVRIKARDPISRRRMEATLDRPIELVADLAFLLRPDLEASGAAEALAWIDRRRGAGDRVVGLNANYLIDAKHPGFSEKLGPLMARLLAKNVSILLVPHDTRTDRSDRHILEEARATVGAGFEDRVRMLEPSDPGMIKAVLGALDLVVTGRMHVAILTMGAGRPALSFGYQGKFEGLYQLLGLAGAGLLLPPSMLVERFDEVGETIARQLDVADELSARIAMSLPAVRDLALANFGNRQPV